MKERVAEIVAAYLKHNSIAADQLPGLIQQVNQALTGIGKEPPAAPTTPPHTPAVSIRRSLRPDEIRCLDCGWSGVILKRHIFTAHGLSIPEYTARWKLPSDYPMIAPNYSVRRSELAKAAGLGNRGRGDKRK
jgi:predicted transcriptional regulator